MGAQGREDDPGFLLFFSKGRTFGSVAIVQHILDIYWIYIGYVYILYIIYILDYIYIYVYIYIYTHCLICY